MSKDVQMRLRLLEKDFIMQSNKLNELLTHLNEKKKSRLLVRRGMEHVALKMKNVALLYTENKIVYVVNQLGEKYIGDKNLGEIEKTLDSKFFFRANRQYIINIDFIKGYKPFEKVKLQVEINLPRLNHPIIISQENAPLFRNWVYNA